MVPAFEKLEIFQRAYKISLEVHHTMKPFLKEDRSFVDQVRRSSKSICANIAEGFGKQKQSMAEFKRFLMIAVGSSNAPISSRKKLMPIPDSRYLIPVLTTTP